MQISTDFVSNIFQEGKYHPYQVTMSCSMKIVLAEFCEYMMNRNNVNNNNLFYSQMWQYIIWTCILFEKTRVTDVVHIQFYSQMWQYCGCGAHPNWVEGYDKQQSENVHLCVGNRLVGTKNFLPAVLKSCCFNSCDQFTVLLHFPDWLKIFSYFSQWN